MAEVVAIIVAGGAGTRMGEGMPKQFLPLGGRPILERTIRALAAAKPIDGILLVLPPGLPSEMKAWYGGMPKVLRAVDGGAERQDSVRNGLTAAPEEAEVILVHDAVRPFVSGDLLARCVERAREQGAVVPVVPVRETVKEWDPKGKTLFTVDRSLLYRTQTPQAFRAGILREAYAKAAAAGLRGTDDASLVEAAGYPVTPIPGEETNIKITIPEDLRMADALLRGETDFRIGLGGDAHRLVEGRELWLGGVRVEHDRGLLGHSDGDVLLHAIADALYGAVGDRDIGFHFPPDREETRGISSRKILEHARQRIEERGYTLVGLDAVVVCEEPKIAPIAASLRASIAKILSVPEERVGLKGKTTEGMGFEGKREGISAWAVALVAGPVPASAPGRGTV